MTENGQTERSTWMGVLARADEAELERQVGSLGPLPAFNWLRAPETGAVITRGRAGGTGAMFSLGEMTVTRAALRMTGSEIVGHGYVQGRSPRKAELAALVDAMMQTPHLAAVARKHVIEPLKVAEESRRLTLRRKAGATKVEFFTFVRAESA